jgi:hypothetical protein
MQLIKKDDLKKAENPLKKIWEEYFWCDGFPTISEHDNDEVIENFLDLVIEDTRVKMDKRFVVDVPDWDIFNGPKEITRSKRKPVVFEEAMIEEEAENANEDAEQDSIDEMVDNATIAGETIEVTQGQEVRAEATASQQDVGTSERQENRDAEVVKKTNAEKEKRSKKRNERPPASEEDQNVRAPKKTKTKLKGFPTKLLTIPKVMSLSLILIAMIHLKIYLLLAKP